MKKIHLILYVAGASPLTETAINSLKKSLIKNELFEDSHLEIVDVFEQPEEAETNDIIATPCLFKKSPLPEKIYIGHKLATNYKWPRCNLYIII